MVVWACSDQAARNIVPHRSISEATAPSWPVTSPFVTFRPHDQGLGQWHVKYSLFFFLFFSFISLVSHLDVESVLNVRCDSSVVSCCIFSHNSKVNIEFTIQQINNTLINTLLCVNMIVVSVERVTVTMRVSGEAPWLDEMRVVAMSGFRRIQRRLNLIPSTWVSVNAASDAFSVHLFGWRLGSADTVGGCRRIKYTTALKSPHTLAFAGLFFSFFVFYNCRAFLSWIEKRRQLSARMVDANASWMLMLAGGGGTMQGVASASFSSGQCREGGGWLVLTGGRGGGWRSRPNMSDMNTEVLEGHGAGLVGSEGVEGF